jgi:hypothetical protein
MRRKTPARLAHFLFPPPFPWPGTGLEAIFSQTAGALSRGGTPSGPDTPFCETAMKKLLWAGVLALPFLALPSEVKAFTIGGYEVDTGARVWCNVRQFNTLLPQAGPWYLYWPYQAHFQVPAAGVSPYFPAPMTLPPGFGQPPPPPPGYGAPAPGYQPPMPAPMPGYRAPMPAGPQGYYPQQQAGPQGYYPQQQGWPQRPNVTSYYGR